MLWLNRIITKKSGIELIVFIHFDISRRDRSFLQIWVDILIYHSANNTRVSTISEGLNFYLVSWSGLRMLIMCWFLLSQPVLESMELLHGCTVFYLLAAQIWILREIRLQLILLQSLPEFKSVAALSSFQIVLETLGTQLQLDIIFWWNRCFLVHVMILLIQIACIELTIAVTGRLVWHDRSGGCLAG